jgi:hypothetical protein
MLQSVVPVVLAGAVKLLPDDEGLSANFALGHARLFERVEVSYAKRVATDRKCGKWTSISRSLLCGVDQTNARLP